MLKVRGRMRGLRGFSTPAAAQFCYPGVCKARSEVSLVFASRPPHVPADPHSDGL